MVRSEARTKQLLFDDGAPRRSIIGQAAFFALWLGVTATGLCLQPNADGHGTHERLGLPACPSVVLFDRPCPGCGLTTSWTALLHGNLALSFHAHPLGPILYGLFTLVAVAAGYGYLAGKRLRTYTDGFSRLAAALVAVFLVFGLARFAVTPHYAAAYERAQYMFGLNR